MAAIKEAHKMDYIMETVGLRKAYKDNIVVDYVICIYLKVQYMALLVQTAQEKARL